MNERIYELAVETGIIKEEEGYYWIQSVDTLEKFAELIVGECRYVMDCNKGSDQNPAWNQALSETSEKIKEHFGIEEGGEEGSKVKTAKGHGDVVQGTDVKTVAKADLGKNKLNLPAGYGDVVQPQKLKTVAKAKGVAEGEAEKNPHTSALGKALYRDLSKEKKASPQQVQRNKERWAQRQQDRANDWEDETDPVIGSRTQFNRGPKGVAEGTSSKNPPQSGIYKVHYGRKNSGGYAYYDKPSTRWLMAFSTPELAKAIAKEYLKVANNLSDASVYVSNYQDNQVAWTKVQGVAEDVFSCPACGLQNPTTTCGLPNCGLIYGVEE